MENINAISKSEIDAWMAGIKYEAAFWSANLSPRKRRRDREERVKDTSPLYYPGEMKKLQDRSIEDLKDRSEIEVMDVGCGLSYLPIPYLGEQNRTIHYVDPLAGIYNRIAKKKKVNLPKIDFGMIEYLNTFYSPESMDYIIIRNALDHSFNPAQGIISALDVLRTGGAFQLNHAENEAEHEHYIGFHQYNITEENGHLIIWNKKERWDINEMLKGYCDIEVMRRNDGKRDRIVCLIEKKKSVSDLVDLSSYEVILTELMDYMERLMTPFFGIGYRLSYYFYSLAHYSAVYLRMLVGK